MNRSNNGNRTSSRGRLVPAIIGGARVLVSTSQFKRDEWTRHSGKNYRGEEAHSVDSKEFGNSVILKKGAAALSMTEVEFDLMSTQRLLKKGYQITAPDGTTLKATNNA